MDKCPTCGGEKREGTTTFTVDFGEGVVVVRNVPATVCEQCGEEWFDDEVSRRLESIVNDARQKETELELVPFKKIAS